MHELGGTRLPAKTMTHPRRASNLVATPQPPPPPLGGLRLTADFLSPIVVGIFLGFWLDRWSNTTPLFLLLLFFLGVGAGFWNLYRMAKRIDEHNRALDANAGSENPKG